MTGASLQENEVVSASPEIREIMTRAMTTNGIMRMVMTVMMMVNVILIIIMVIFTAMITYSLNLPPQSLQPHCTAS